MQIKAVKAPGAGHRTDVFVVFRTKGGAKRLSAVPDSALRKAGEAALKSSEFDGGAGETLLLHGGSNGQRLVLAGCGDSKKPAGDDLRRAAASAARAASGDTVRRVTYLSPGGAAEAGLVAEGVGLALYSFDSMKSGKPKKVAACEVAPESGKGEGVAAAVKRANAIVAGACLTRDLGNLPGNVANAAYLAKRARELSGGGITVKVHDRAGINRLKMGAFAAVALGSANEPRFIEIKYRGAKKSAPTIALVGKGVTFDTGGISLKPGAKMEDMKFDMCGGGTVIGTIHAIKALKLKVNVDAYVPATDNMPAATAYRPGDIVTARNKKTIEIINTDAEGRLLLCDALAYAAEKKPSCLIDLATLTGACVVALGDVASGLFSNDDKLRSDIEASGKAVGEMAWPLPLHATFTKMMRGTYADLKNSGGRWGGACTAAAFLEQFVADCTWAHIDIAGVAWTDKDKGYHRVGATGYGVRLLVEFLSRRAES